MKFSSGEKKMLAFCVVAIALPLGVGLTLNRINATPIVNIPAPAKTPKPNGFDLYVVAMATVRFKPEIDPSSDSAILTDPKARAKRYGLPRRTAWLQANIKAFGTFQQALKTPTLAPPVRSFSVATPSFAKLHQLARDKVAQSNTRWMAKDYNGALQSTLDTIQMGHDIRRGGAVMPTLVGTAIGAVGCGNNGDTIEHLNASHAKIGARRLEQLLQTRWNLPEVLTEEKWLYQVSMLEIFGMKDWRSPVTTSLEKDKITLANRWRVLTIPKQRIIDDIGANYDRQIANARLPYSQKGVPQSDDNDPFTFDELKSMRQLDARDLVADQMLMLRLALHAYKLENGAYPPTLNALVPGYIKSVPADPFGGGEPLRYKLSGQTYKLWSIGPDGIDDGGKPIPPRAGRRTPQNFPGERPRGPRAFVEFEGKGDVVAGVNTG